MQPLLCLIKIHNYRICSVKLETIDSLNFHMKIVLCILLDMKDYMLILKKEKKKY